MVLPDTVLRANIVAWNFHWLSGLDHLGGASFCAWYSTTFLMCSPVSFTLLLPFTASCTCKGLSHCMYNTHALLSLQSYSISIFFYSCSAILNQSLSHTASDSRRAARHIYFQIYSHSHFFLSACTPSLPLPSKQQHFSSEKLRVTELLYQGVSFSVIFLRLSQNTD